MTNVKTGTLTKNSDGSFYFVSIEMGTDLYSRYEISTITSNFQITAARSVANMIAKIGTFLWYNTTANQENAVVNEIVYGTFNNYLVRETFREDTVQYGYNSKKILVRDSFATKKLQAVGSEENDVIYTQSDNSISCLKMENGLYKRLFDVYIPRTGKTIENFYADGKNIFMFDENNYVYKFNIQSVKLEDTLVNPSSFDYNTVVKYIPKDNMLMVTKLAANDPSATVVESFIEVGYISTTDSYLSWKNTLKNETVVRYTGLQILDTTTEKIGYFLEGDKNQEKKTFSIAKRDLSDASFNLLALYTDTSASILNKCDYTQNELEARVTPNYMFIICSNQLLVLKTQDLSLHELM